jgi:hypothetical protein
MAHAGTEVSLRAAECMTAGVMQTGAATGEVVSVKPKQFKTKVIERPGKGDRPPSWLVEVGSAHLKVYATPVREKEFFTLSYWVDGKRVRRVFSDEGGGHR